MRLKSINSRISIIVVLAVFIAIFLLVAYVARSTQTLAVDVETQAMQEIAKLEKVTLDNYLKGLLAQAKNLAGQDAIRATLQGEQLGEAKSRFTAFIKSSDDNWAAFAFDLNGTITSGINAKMADLAGGSRKDRDYVKEIVAGKDTCVTQDILKAASGDDLIFGVAAAVKDASGKTIGGVALFPYWNRFSKDFIDTVKLGNTGYALILDRSGKLIAHPDKGLLLKDLSEHGFIKDILAKKSGTQDYTWKDRGKLMSFESSALTGWIIGVCADKSDLLAVAHAQRNIMAGAGIGIALVLVTIIMLTVRRLVTTPLAAVAAYAGEISREKFSATLSGTFRYEVADLAESIQAMVAVLKHKLGLSQGVLAGMTAPYLLVDTEEKALFINRECLRMVELDGEPADYLGQTLAEIFYNDPTRQTVVGKAMKTGESFRDKVAEITGHKGGKRTVNYNVFPLFDLDGTCIGGFCLYHDLTEVKDKERQIILQNEKIAEVARRADSISEQVSSASHQLSAQVEESSRGSNQQRVRTSEAATAMDQINTSVVDVARNASEAAQGADQAKHKAQDGASIVEEAIKAIFEVRDKALSMKASLGELGSRAESIGQVIGVIDDIADQTNLLALNAAIEAARAGDAGRGFAVVADEVRKLAEKTMTATKEVGGVVKAIQEGTTASVTAMEGAVTAVEKTTGLAEKAGVSLQEIVTLVETTAERVTTIAAASEEQSASTEQVSRSIEEISRISSETADSLDQSAQAVNGLATLAETLKDVIRTMQS